MRINVDIVELVNMVVDNHRSIAEASRQTGLSPAYLSRIKNGSLKPKHVSEETLSRLQKGLTSIQTKAMEEQAPYLVSSPSPIQNEVLAMSDEDIMTWIKQLSPKQREALLLIIGMIP